MELKDQILQTKERKKGFLKAMPESTRTQVDTYTKLDKISKNYWIPIACGVLLAVVGYLIACLSDKPGSWIANLIPAVLLVVGSVIAALYIKSMTNKAKKAIALGVPDYVEELNAINARLLGLEKAEKARVEVEKQEAKAKARAEAAQRKADEAAQRQQAAVQGTNPQPSVPQQPINPPLNTPDNPPEQQ